MASRCLAPIGHHHVEFFSSSKQDRWQGASCQRQESIERLNLKTWLHLKGKPRLFTDFSGYFGDAHVILKQEIVAPALIIENGFIGMVEFNQVKTSRQRVQIHVIGNVGVNPIL